MPRSRLISIRPTVAESHLHVALSRPDRYNVVDVEMLAELAVVLEQRPLSAMPLVLEGDGESFSLGVDVRELANFSQESAATYSRIGQQAVAALEAWPGVTIARLHGYTLGLGLELALGCDVLVADPRTRIGLPGLAWALMPCLGGLRRLNRRVGPALSRELFLRGRMLTGVEALERGLIDRLASSDDDIGPLVRELGEFIPGAVRAIRDLRLVRHGIIDAAVEAALFAEAFVNGECQRRLRGLL